MLLSLLVGLVGLGVLGVPGTPLPDRAGAASPGPSPGAPPGPGARAVPDERCARHDTGIRRGACFADPGGGTYWLGTLRGYDGVEMYCIDYAFATDWGVGHRLVVVRGDLRTSLGGRVGAATVAALNALVTAHPASRVDDRTAAAIALVIRQVMSDVSGDPGTGHGAGHGLGHGMGGGLTVAGRVRDVAFIGADVVRRARSLWADAVAHRGPWRLAIGIDPGPDAVVTPGERLAATVRGTSGAGRPQDMRVRLGYHGFAGPSSVRLGADGAARVELTAPVAPGSATVTARVTGAPSRRPELFRPLRWAVNPHPGQASRHSQRGLIGHQDSVEARATATAVIVRSTPTLVTQASAQRVEPGALVHDSVVVAGTGGAAGEFRWSLLGPVPPDAAGSCPGAGAEVWGTASVLARGTVTTSGDGTWTTPDYRVRPADVGCLTYVEDRPGTSTTEPVATAPGVPAETTLVVRPKSQPCLATATSRQRALLGDLLQDRVQVGCISGPDRIRVSWTLHGPLAPSDGASGKAGCERIAAARWAGSPVAARGAFDAERAGSYLTGQARVGRPGCYTWSENAAATGTTLAATSPPGLAVETSLVTRKPVSPVPSVPTGPSAVPRARLALSRLDADRARAGARAGAGAGVGVLRVPSLGIQVPVDPVGVRGGAVAVPGSTGRIGWLSSTAVSSDVVGASVLAGHVSDHADRPGPLAALARARRGQQVVWVDAAGVAHRFTVTGVARYPRSRPLPVDVFRTDGPHLLRLITCTSRITLPGGGFHYADNLVVTAQAVTPAG
ncbi:class F sortase [Marmoricola sp. RAF53]|uniref:class F sortase n=1 Tax=Marmoricola sp. RAF53 TaxID=3233059 RepID=UPI003F9E77C7